MDESSYEAMLNGLLDNVQHQKEQILEDLYTTLCEKHNDVKDDAKFYQSSYLEDTDNTKSLVYVVRLSMYVNDEIIDYMESKILLKLSGSE